MGTKKPGPRRTGSVEPGKRADGTVYYRARVRLADDSRVRVDVPAKYAVAAGGKSGRERAEDYAEAAQEREDETGELLSKRTALVIEVKKKHEARHGETCEQFFKRFLENRSSTGKVRRARDLRGSWDTWISPRLGTKTIAGITRDDVEDVRDALDEQVSKRKMAGGIEGLSGARARNVWSVLASMMKEACTSKLRTLRVRDDNPCSTVQPPDKTDARAKTFIYPSEFLTLTACADVPLAWRETYAVACYLYLRPGELRVLTWSDVDFDAGVVHVTKAYDEDSATVKAPKTRNGVRDVPIPPQLVPLLKAMRERAPAPKGAAFVVPLMQDYSERRRAGWMRKHFVLAKIDRARLTEKSATTMQINFRSWRDTGITWLALQGVDVAKIQRRAGHDVMDTTMGYVKAAEDLTGSIGEPFPPLPTALVPRASAAGQAPAAKPNRANDRAKLKKRAQRPGKTAERAGFEPAVRF